MKQRLLGKLLLVNLPVIAVIIGVVWLAVDHLAAGYFMVLMDEYMVAPTETHQAFLTAVHQALLWASLGALLLAFGLSYLLTRRVLRPLSAMGRATRAVAAGRFDVRVESRTADEIGELGAAFNRMADALEHLEGLRRRMVADVAHELRTPLTNLRGYLEALSDGVLPPDTANLRMLQDEVLRLVHLVEDLGRLSRAEASRGVLQREAIDLGRAVGELLALERPNLEARRLAVSSEIPPGTMISADRDKLLQALRNLVENAWKYTPAGGWVRIGSERRGKMLRVTIANSGPGIAAEDLPYIFERFYRGDPSRSRALGGAGIGLAIVRELIAAHGGRVGAESAEGATRVWIELPVEGGDSGRDR